MNWERTIPAQFSPVYSSSIVPGGLEDLPDVSQQSQSEEGKGGLQVVCDSGNSIHLIDNPACNGFEERERELVRLSAHEVTGCNSAKAINNMRIDLGNAGRGFSMG